MASHLEIDKAEVKRDELATVQQNLLVSKQTFAKLEEEKKQFEYLLSIRQYDKGQRGNDDPLNPDNKQDNENNDSVVELWSDDDTEERIVSSLTSPTQQLNATTVQVLHELVIEFMMEKEYEVAEQICKYGLEDLEKITGHDHPHFATLLHLLAAVYSEQKKYKEAANLLNDALAIREKTFGENHPAVAATLNKLAVIYAKLKEHKEAEPLCKRALEIKEKIFGKEHPDLANQLYNLASLCDILGKYEEAEAYYQRAIKMYELKLGLDDPNVHGEN